MSLVRTQLRVPEDVHAEIKDIADAQERSFNKEVVLALRNHVRAHKVEREAA